MKINRISQALGSISDEYSREAIEEIEKTSNQNDSIIPDGKPRVVSEDKSRKAPIFIALAGLCAAAIALPLVLKNVGKNSLVASDNSSGVAASAPKVEKLGYDLDGLEDYREYKFEFTMPEYEGVAFECMHNKITANGEVIVSGMPILQVYLADLNGDGRREIVSDSAYGSGILHKVISACDYSEKQLFMLSQRGIERWLDLFENNGELWVRETEYRTKNVLSEKKLELSDMKKIDGFTQEPVRATFDGAEIPCVDNYESIQEQALESYVFETHTYDEYTVKLVGKQVYKLGQNVTDYVYANRLCIEVEKGGKLLDSFTPNPGYYNLNGITDRPKFTVFADKVGSYLDLYELELPVIAMRYYFNENQAVKKAVQFAVIKDEMIYANFLSTAESGTGVTLFQDDFATNFEDNQTCFASVFEAEKFRVADSTTLVDDEACIKYTFNIADMLNTGILTTTEKVVYPTSSEVDSALDALRKELVENQKILASEAAIYVNNYAVCDLDFDGEDEILVVNTFGTPMVHVFGKNGETYKSESVFSMKALDYTDYKLVLKPYENGDERYYYFTFHNGGGTMEADVLGAIKPLGNGYEAEYLYSWGTLDYKDISEPVKKEFYRKGWDKYDIALTDSNPNDIPKEELAEILKMYGITLDESISESNIGQTTIPDFYGDVKLATFDEAVNYAKELGFELRNFEDNPDFVQYNVGFVYPNTDKERVVSLDYQFKDFTISVQRYSEDNCPAPNTTNKSFVYNGSSFFFEDTYGDYRLALIDKSKILYCLCVLDKPDDSNVVKNLMLNIAAN